MKLRQAMDKARRQTAQNAAPVITLMDYKAEGPPALRRPGPPKTPAARIRHVAPDVAALVENKCICFSPYTAALDQYKILRTRIEQGMRAGGFRTLMITSAVPGDGKSLCAVNLAVSFAREPERTVLLVDADLRRQMIYKYLCYDSRKGLGDFLVNQARLGDILVRPGIDKMSVISGGALVQGSTELLGSLKMQALVAELKTRYPDRYVIFDTPPLLGQADAITFAPLVDAVVMVVRAGHTAIQDIRAAARLIPPEKFLGFVLNRMDGSLKTYGYA